MQNQIGTRIVVNTDADYPERMKEILNMPERLYVRGNLPDLGPSISVVGARKCSPYGRSMAYELGKFAAENGIQVISGMALGIDSYAHEGALAGGGKTYAVLGCGTDICYPGSSRGIYEQIIKSGGIISEYEDGTEPYRHHFPLRNRIISALGDVIIVVEGRRKSGSLITVDHALNQGKTVLAVPGRITDVVSEGPNKLIAQGAGIICEPKDMLGAFGMEMLADFYNKKRNETLPDISDTGLKIYSAIEYEPVNIEKISEKTGICIAECESAVLELILSDIVVEIMPHYYARK